MKNVILFLSILSSNFSYAAKPLSEKDKPKYMELCKKLFETEKVLEKEAPEYMLNGQKNERALKEADKANKKAAIELREFAKIAYAYRDYDESHSRMKCFMEFPSFKKKK